MTSVESLVEHIVKKQQGIAHFILKKTVCQTEVILVIQYIEILNHTLVGDISSGETNHLIKDRESVTHTPIRFERNHVQGFRLRRDSFFRRYVSQMVHSIIYADTVKVVNLTTRQDGRKNLMFLRCCKNKYGVAGRLFKCFQKSIECRS